MALTLTPTLTPTPTSTPTFTSTSTLTSILVTPQARCCSSVRETTRRWPSSGSRAASRSISSARASGRSPRAGSSKGSSKRTTTRSRASSAARRASSAVGRRGAGVGAPPWLLARGGRCAVGSARGRLLVIGYRLLHVSVSAVDAENARQSANHGTLDRSTVHLTFTNRRAGARGRAPRPSEKKPRGGPPQHTQTITANRGARRSVDVTASRDCTVHLLLHKGVFLIPRLDPALLQDSCDSHVAGMQATAAGASPKRALLDCGRFSLPHTRVHTHTHKRKC